MTYGLLKGTFHHANEICSLRSVVRQRAAKVQEQSRCVQHMQKALTQMKIQLDNVVSNPTGKTGLSVLPQFVGGERDPQKLAALRDRRLRASEQAVARSLHGNWREEHLLPLTQAFGSL